jgi:hypothetical protein
MIYHVLPGDAHVDDIRQTGLTGDIVFCREALVDGDLNCDTLDEFFSKRAAFINRATGEDPALYDVNVASQFRKLLDVDGRDEVNLWFEYELFCAVNMWFCLSLLHGSGAAIYRVAPANLGFEDRWNGFANTNAKILRECYDRRVRLSESDCELGVQLWDAFRRRDSGEIQTLASIPQNTFPYLEEVGHAAAEIDSKPAEIIREIKGEGKSDLKQIFPEFRRRAGVYGFGDLQVKRLMEK